MGGEAVSRVAAPSENGSPAAAAEGGLDTATTELVVRGAIIKQGDSKDVSGAEALGDIKML